MTTDDAARFAGRLAFITGGRQRHRRHAPAGRTCVLESARPGVTGVAVAVPKSAVQRRASGRQMSRARSGVKAPIR